MSRWSRRRKTAGRVAALALLLAVGATPCEGSEGKGATVLVGQAIEVADQAVGGGKGRPAELELVTAKKFDTAWNDVVPTSPSDSAHEALLSKLEDRTYWLIYYRSRTSKLGGDVAVFVDAETADVIHVYRGR